MFAADSDEEEPTPPGPPRTKSSFLCAGYPKPEACCFQVSGFELRIQLSGFESQNLNLGFETRLQVSSF